MNNKHNLTTKCYGVVYALVVCGKVRYIGQATDYKRRLRFHRFEARGNNPRCPVVARALQKHGANAKFTPLLSCLDEQSLHAAEIHLIRHYNTLAPNGYNLTEGGTGGRRSAEVGRKIKAANKGRRTWQTHDGAKHPMLGRTHTAETKAKMRAAKLGKKRAFSAKHCRALSAANQRTAKQRSAQQKRLWTAKRLSADGLPLFAANFSTAGIIQLNNSRA